MRTTQRSGTQEIYTSNSPNRGRGKGQGKKRPKTYPNLITHGLSKNKALLRFPFRGHLTMINHNRWSLLGALIVVYNVVREGIVLSRIQWGDASLLDQPESINIRKTAPSRQSGEEVEEEKREHEATFEAGILSNKETSFFRALQETIDTSDNEARCQRYGFKYNATQPANRKIYYGALIADEPEELFEIVAAEAYGIYSGMVLVESNRTQNFTPRPFRRLHYGPRMAQLFGLNTNHNTSSTTTTQAQVRAYINEDWRFVDMDREHAQREGILKGWKELGMQPDDVGLIADIDETYSRDFLRAVQVCHGVHALDFHAHHCEHSQVKIVAVSRVFESSPECITKGRSWFHPGLIVGHCIEGIAPSSSNNKPALRTNNSFMRAPGYGKKCHDWDEEKKITNGSYPLWSAADFRRTCGGKMIAPTKKHKDFDRYTAFHFHNFVAQFNSTRFKYGTYGHHDDRAANKRIPQLSNDLQLMYQCVMELPEEPKQRWKREPQGFAKLKPFLPIYFQDDDYRQRRHAHVKRMVELDDALMESFAMFLG